VFRTFLNIIFCLLIFATPMFSIAQTIHVPLNIDNIHDAVKFAIDGDIILLADGTYTCTQTIDFRGKDIVLTSIGNPQKCTIVFNGVRGFSFHSNETENAKINNITIKGAKASDGGAIYIENASPEFENCIFLENSAITENGRGGAIYCKNATPFFNKCYFIFNQSIKGGAIYLDENANATFNEITVTHNTVTKDGGAIYLYKSTPNLIGINIKYNKAIESNGSGGGLYINQSSPVIIYSQIKHNMSDKSGGGIFINLSTKVVLEDCSVFSNTVTNGDGGGIYLNQTQSTKFLKIDIIGNDASDNGGGLFFTADQSPVIENSYILHNTAGKNGGAIYMDSVSSLKLTNLVVTENKASQNGGAFYFDTCSPASEIVFCTFGRNKTSTKTQGILYFNNTSATITNSILWNEDNIDFDEIVLNAQSSVTVSFSDIQMYTGVVYEGDGNINKDPVFEMQANPGSKGTYFHLDEKSPCINTGIKNETIPGKDLTEKNRDYQGSKYDMGAFEFTFVEGVELKAKTPTSGRDPLTVEFSCLAAPSYEKTYTFTMDFGDGSEYESNLKGNFTHEYNGGEYEAKCKVTYDLEQEDIYSMSNSVVINVASLKWKFNTGGVIESSPAIGLDETIYVGSDSGIMFAITPEGNEKWRFQTGGRITSSPTAYTLAGIERIVFGSEDKNVYALRADNGEEIWRFPTYGEVYSSPAIDKEGNIYIGSCDYNLYAITPDGQRKWTFFTNDRVTSSPAIKYFTNRYGELSKTIYIGSQDDYLYALYLDNGKPKWPPIDVGGNIFGSPAINYDGTIFIAACDVIGSLAYHKLLAINPGGTIKWEYEMRRGAYASPALYSDIRSQLTVGSILLGSYDNSLYSLTYDGLKDWAFPTRSDPGVQPGDILSTAAVGEFGTVFVGSENHSVYAIDYEKGLVRWSYATGGPIHSSPVLSDDAVLYVGSFDKCLHAIKTNTFGLSSSSPWPMFRKNKHHHAYIELKEEDMPPTILETYPAINSQNAPAEVPITITVTFSKVMNSSTIDISFETAMDSEKLDKNTIDFKTVYNDDKYFTIASFKPISPTTLEYDTRYKIKIGSNAEDLDKNKLQGDFSWIFYSEPEIPDDNSSSSGMRGCFIDTISAYR